jgi:AcrR family transcriptional regulator
VAAGTSGRPSDGERRAEILEIAAKQFASSGYVGTSLKDVADACGILPGSLYHHFASKEAIAVELLERYRAELDEIGRSFAAKRWAADRPAVARVTLLGTAVAGCAVRHRAALQLSAYEPHAGATPALVALARPKPVAATRAMARILADGADRGEIRSTVNGALLAEQLVTTMLHVGLVTLHRRASAKDAAELLCTLLMYGIAAKAPTDRALDRSAAMSAAVASVREWQDPGEDGLDERQAALRAVAQTEFARRGYEATTIRDIAAAAGMGTGTVYRLVSSKEELLASIMTPFHTRLSDGYASVAGSGSTAIEQLDALTWLNLIVLDRFAAEVEIQRAWFRSRPPAGTYPADALGERARRIHDIVERGVRDGGIRSDDVGLDLLTACIRDLIWVPRDVAGQLGPRAALLHSRETLLRGAATAAGRTPGPR